MLKPTVKRGLMLDFIPDEIICPAQINENRIYKLNNNSVKNGDIVYLCTRELRLEDNWAIIFGFDLAKKHNKKFKIIVILNQIQFSKQQEKFLHEGLNFLQKNSALSHIEFEISSKLPNNIGALIVDFNPLTPHPNPPPQGGREYARTSIQMPKKFSTKTNTADSPSPLEGEGWGGGTPTPDCAIFEVDSHNIIPARFISDKQEFSAATLRRKIYANIADFLTEYPRHAELVSASHNCILLLKDFIDNKLDDYAEGKNNPQNDVTSGLSPYLHFGFISSQRAALEVIKSRASRANKEAFLEELIVRKELSDNFCLYSKSFSTLEGLLPWAKATLNEHKNDIRTYLYSLNEFEQAKTHDILWNKIQEGLLKTGRIHGYPRMYWAKKILEWSKTPNEALKIAIYLNDTYALDGNDPNGYVGILWSIGGLHDRPFSNRLVTGKIRYMRGNNIKL